MRAFLTVFCVNLLLAGCTTTLVVVNAPPCEPRDVPADAKIVSTQRVDLATFPQAIPARFTGCQRIWQGKSGGSMRILATSYFEGGRLVRLIGKEQDGLEYDCHYRDGALQEGPSLRPERCPNAAVIEANS